MNICKKAFDLIVFSEVTSRKRYDLVYTRPTWPHGESGVTIGIGYDLGYATRADIDRDWSMLTDVARTSLKKVAGLRGAEAGGAVSLVRDMTIPWDAAITVFERVSLPRYVKQALAAFPGSDKLPAECSGALVSLVYNRGTSMDGARRAEMKAIRDLITAGDLAGVPAQLRSMKRLWPTMEGLRTRRENEARLWEEGLRDG